MWSSENFRMADGAEIVGHESDGVRMRIAIPMDPEGFLGRQCPACSQTFRIDSADYQGLPEEVELWCVYCGHHAEHSEFLTDQQRDRVLRAVGDYGLQLVGQILSDSFREVSTPRPRSGFGIEISVRSQPFYPQPLPGIDEERLVRIRHCAECALRYAVFGEHRFCPVCGQLPAATVAVDALAAELARLDALADLPAESASTLREQGVFTRIWVDTLENLVGLVETLANARFHGAVPDHAQRLRGKGNIFQRLDDAADLFKSAGFADLRDTLDAPTWQRLQRIWATRHAFTHNDGMVDGRYLARVPDSLVGIGQRLTISDEFCRNAIADTEALCRAIATLTI